MSLPSVNMPSGAFSVRRIPRTPRLRPALFPRPAIAVRTDDSNGQGTRRVSNAQNSAVARGCGVVG
jgi:hypothetical protein